MPADTPPTDRRPTVSVITPSFNQGRFLGATLRSVAGQDYPILEHQVVDGGSTDETLEVLRAAARPGLHWVSERDRGQAHAVNKGIARTRGDIVAWINSDDVYYPGAIGAAADYLAGHPEVDVLYGAADHLDEAGAVLAPYPTEAFDLAQLHQTCFICQPATFFRRACVARFGLLDERLHYCLDYEYWLRLARGGARFAFLPRKLAGSRLHAATKTLSGRVASHRETIEMFLRLQGRVPESWLLGYASVTVAERVDRARHPRVFAARGAVAALLAALRWNHWISARLLRLLFARLLRGRAGAELG
jgi:glycosyltransferase involved in cell wall biosynthesis